MEFVTRPAQGGDTGDLKRIWKEVFGDTDELIGAFFRHYGAETAIVALVGGDVAAAGYLLPVGSLILPDGQKYPCAMIYSVAVLPAHRRGGIGARLTQALISAGQEGGYPAIVLCPASDGLFDYYSGRTGLRDWFYISERIYSAPRPANGRLTRLTAKEYVRMRSGLLSGLAHIGQDERTFSFQGSVCEQTGGGLYAVAAPGGADACAVVEAGGTVAVQELLTPEGGGGQAALAVIADAFPAEEYIVRSPACGAAAGYARRFGMLAADTPSPVLAVRYDGAWFGPAFD